MTQEESVPIEERIRNDWNRLKSIQESGKDVKKLMSSLKRITDISKKANSEDIESALSKLEEYLSRIEAQMSDKKIIPQTSKPVEDETDQTETTGETEKAQTADVTESTEESESVEEKEKRTEIQETGEAADPEKQKGEIRSELAKAEATQTEIPMEAEIEENGTEPESEKKTDDHDLNDKDRSRNSGKESGSSKSKETEDTAPIAGESEITEEKDEDDDESKARGMVEEIEGFDSEVGVYKGDSTPIRPHIDAMKNAFGKKDMGMFEQYYRITKEWFEKYLVNLISRSNIALVDRIKAHCDHYSSFGKLDRIKNNYPEIEAILNENGSQDLQVLRDIQSTLIESLEGIEKDLVTMTSDIESEIAGIISDLLPKLAIIGDETKRENLEKRMDDIKGMISTDTLKAFELVKEINIEVLKEFSHAEKEKFESILRSIEPMLSKLSDPSLGMEEVSSELIRERDRLIGLLPTDPEASLKGMEDLLGKATIKTAEIEENFTSDIEMTIASVKKDLEELEGAVETAPVMNIIHRASDTLEEGNFIQSRDLVEKAKITLVKIKEKAAIERANSSLDDIMKRRDEMSEMTIDTTPLDGPIEDARKAIEKRDLDEFATHMDTLKGKLSLMKNEELKVEYQKLLIKVMNEIKELKGSGEVDTKPFDDDLAKVKELFLSKELDASVDLERNIISRIRKIKLTRNVKNRLELVERTVQEADGLLVDINKPKQSISQAREMVEKEMIEEALDLLVETQVDIEFRMTSRTFSMIEKEIRDGWKEAKSHSIDLGDIESKIHNAYNLADDDMFKEALEHLYGLRERVVGEVEQIRAKVLLDELADLIKTARSLGLKIATFKASHTKSKVLLEAGDPPGSIDLTERQIEALTERIENRKELQDRLDSLRGKLIGLETKIGKIVEKGLPVNMFEESMKEIHEFIEISEAERAENKFEELDSEMNKILSGKTEEKKKAEKIPAEMPAVHSKIDEERSVDLDPSDAKKKLVELVAIISKEMKERSSHGEEIDTVKRDIQNIQNLVIKKDYISALNIANSTMDRLKA